MGSSKTETSPRRGPLDDRPGVDPGQRPVIVSAAAFQPRAAEGVGHWRAGADQRRGLKGRREPVAKVAGAALEVREVAHVGLQARYMGVERGALALRRLNFCEIDLQRLRRAPNR